MRKERKEKKAERKRGIMKRSEDEKNEKVPVGETQQR
jgi:hypothetical protein